MSENNSQNITASQNIRDSIGRKPEELLTAHPRADRPLFFVMVIMVFLACLAATSAHASYRAAGAWGQDLKYSATVQIKPALDQDGQALANRAVQILETLPEIARASPLSKAQSTALLRPWIGNIELPETLPIPYLIDVALTPGSTLDVSLVSALLADENIKADVDDHGRWNRDIARTARAAQIIAIGALMLLTAATMAAAGFATQSGLAARRTIIDVLSHVGARDRYIARLFTERFGWIGLKAGVCGALLAGAVAGLFWLLSGAGDSPLVPSFAIDYFDLLLLACAPFISGFVCALAARVTVLKTLAHDKPT